MSDFKVHFDLIQVQKPKDKLHLHERFQGAFQFDVETKPEKGCFYKSAFRVDLNFM